MADDKEEVDTHDPHYEPIIQLPDVPTDTKTLEEDEDEVLKLRAKLFRFDTSESPGEWKERGTGEVKLLLHRHTARVRIVMRRDKTHKLCANHYIDGSMNLIPSAGSDRAWVWHTAADFADGETKEERLAIRFANAENAQKFKTHFDNAKGTDEGNKTNGAGDAENEESESEDAENEKDVDTSKEKEETSDEHKVAETSQDSGAADAVTDKLADIHLSDSTKESNPGSPAKSSVGATEK